MSHSIRSIARKLADPHNVMVYRLDNGGKGKSYATCRYCDDRYETHGVIGIKQLTNSVSHKKGCKVPLAKKYLMENPNEFS